MTLAEPRTSAMRATRQTLVANVVIAVIGVATGSLAAHILGPRGRGELAAIQLLPSVFAVLAMLGMHDALAFFCAREPDRANEHLPSAVALACVSSVLFVAVGYVLLPTVLHNFAPEVVAYARRYLLLIPLYALVMLPSHVLRGTSQFGWWNVLRVAPALAWLVVLLLAAVLGHDSAGGLADGNLIATAATGLLVVAVVRRNVPGPYRTDTESVRKLGRYGLPAAGAAFPQVLNLRLDQLIMAAVLSPRVLGLYVVAVAWSSAVNPVLFAIGLVLLPRVAGSLDEQERDRIILRAVRVSTWAAIGLVGAVTLITPLAFGLLFPRSFSGAVPAAAVLVGAGGLFGLNFVLAEGVRGLGRPKITLYAEFAGLGVTALALAALLGWLGIVGAALASVVGYAAVTATLLRFLRQQVPGLRGNVLTLSAAREAFNAMMGLVRQRAVG